MSLMTKGDVTNDNGWCHLSFMTIVWEAIVTLESKVTDTTQEQVQISNSIQPQFVPNVVNLQSYNNYVADLINAQEE